MNRPILNYHSVGTDQSSPLARWTISPELFHRQLDLLVSRGLRGVTMAQALDDPSPDQVALTFDDGYEDFASEAAPALSARGFSATLYVITADVGKETGWPGGEARLMATWEQLRELDSSGFEIGAHSHTHPQLDLLSPDDLLREVATSRAQLEDQLGHQVRGFCYPHGFHSRRVCRAVIDAGFDYACAVKHKMSSDDDDRFALARIVMSSDTSPDQMSHWLDGRHLRPGGVRVERTLAAPFRTYRRTQRLLSRTSP